MRTFLAEDVRHGSCELDPGSTGDALEDLFPGRSGDLSLEDPLDVGREGPSATLGSPNELGVEGVGDVPNLDHLAHGGKLTHVRSMRNRAGR